MDTAEARISRQIAAAERLATVPRYQRSPELHGRIWAQRTHAQRLLDEATHP